MTSWQDIQKEIQDAAYKYQQEIEQKQRIIVGVNEFTAMFEGTKNARARLA